MLWFPRVIWNLDISLYPTVHFTPQLNLTQSWQKDITLEEEIPTVCPMNQPSLWKKTSVDNGIASLISTIRALSSHSPESNVILKINISQSTISPLVKIQRAGYFFKKFRPFNYPSQWRRAGSQYWVWDLWAGASGSVWRSLREFTLRPASEGIPSTESLASLHPSFSKHPSDGEAVPLKEVHSISR